MLNSSLGSNGSAAVEIIITGNEGIFIPQNFMIMGRLNLPQEQTERAFGVLVTSDQPQVAQIARNENM